MKNNFRAEIDARLSELTFTREAEVLEKLPTRRQARPIPKRTVALILALMLMLCGTAVALTLRYSARLDLERHARGVLTSKYGLTGEMLDLFSPHVERDGAAWTVRYLPIGWEAQMGEYTVTGSEDGDTQAVWSHDGEEPSDSVWGPEQLQQFMEVRLAQRSAMASAENLGDLTLEELAAIDAPLLDLPGAAGQWLSVVPGEDDIQQADAERMAVEAVMAKWGIPGDELAACRIRTHFYLFTDDNRHEYRIWVEGGHELGTFDVMIASPSGEITRNSWWSSPETVRLPEGDLALYPAAAEEFVKEGGFDLLPPEEKAAVYLRYEAAGLTDLLPPGVYVTPAATDLNEQAAVTRARETLMETCAFPERAFDLFGVRTAMLRGEAGREWQVRFIGLDQYHHYWLDHDTLGEYTVTVAADGQIVGCEWSLAERYEGGFTEKTFGQSDVLAGELLTWAMELRDKLDQIIAGYPEFQNRDDLPLEDLAAYDALMRDAGFDQRTYSHLLPEEGEIQEAEAIELARQVLKDEFGLTDAILDNSRMEVYFLMAYYIGDEPVKGWDIAFKGEEIYTVFINAADGIIEQIVHDDLSLSNG